VQIDALAGEEWTRDDSVGQMRAIYEHRKRRLAARAGKSEDEGYEDRSLAWQRMQHLALGAQGDVLVWVRERGNSQNQVMNRVLRELDLEEERLEPLPEGGGSPEAAGRAFGEQWCFLPIGALVVDFALTIAISIAAAGSALIAYAPGLAPARIPLALGLVALVAGLTWFGHGGRVIFAVPGGVSWLIVLGYRRRALSPLARISFAGVP
jgi:hypothetical protein